mgnify:FL=1
MNETIGKRIANLRKEKNLKQDNLAEMLNVSPQAVSKWENDLTCPDISILPSLAKILGVSVDELLSGKQEIEPVVTLVPEEKRKDIKEMMLRITVESVEGDKVRINLPVPLIQAAIEMGLDISEVSGNNNLKNIDFTKILEMAKKGAVGNLVEVESAEGDKVNIFIE